MKDFDKLFDDLFSGDFPDIEAELDELDALEDEGEKVNSVEVQETETVVDEGGRLEDDVPSGRATESATTLSFYNDDEDDDGGGDGDGDPEAEDEEDEDDDDKDDNPIEDTEVGGAFESSCPNCGEAVSIFLDPAGGSVQDYVEDCSVCCQPMVIQVRFGGDGQAGVTIDTAD